MTNWIKTSLYRCFSIIPGTIARPHAPNGRRALFYRDQNGDHRPLGDLLKMKLGIVPGPHIGFLGPVKYFRQLLNIQEPVGALPLGMRELIFEKNKMAGWRKMACGIPEVIWDREGIKTLTLQAEIQTGTWYMRPEQMLSIPGGA